MDAEETVEKFNLRDEEPVVKEKRETFSTKSWFLTTCPGKESAMKILWSFFGIALLGLMALGCQQVQKPELNGQGPLAVKVARGTVVPEYHAPAERWRIQHQEALNRGDFNQKECVLCHNPQTGCNQCHQYAGAKQISVPEAALFWPAHGK